MLQRRARRGPASSLERLQGAAFLEEQISVFLVNALFCTE